MRHTEFSMLVSKIIDTDKKVLELTEHINKLQYIIQQLLKEKENK